MRNLGVIDIELLWTLLKFAALVAFILLPTFCGVPCLDGPPCGPYDPF